MSKAFHIALSGMVAALCIVLLLSTGLFPFATVALPALAGVLTVAVVVECGIKWALLVYVGVSVLSFFITPEPSAAYMFVLFFGYYPIIKSPIERIHIGILEWAIKFLVANAAMICLFVIARWLFMLDEILPQYQVLGKYTFLVFWLGVNVVFLIYDFALTRLIGWYYHLIKPKIVDRMRYRGRK